MHSLVAVRDPRDEPNNLSGGSLLHVSAHLSVLRTAVKKRAERKRLSNVENAWNSETHQCLWANQDTLVFHRRQMLPG